MIANTTSGVGGQELEVKVVERIRVAIMEVSSSHIEKAIQCTRVIFLPVDLQPPMVETTSISVLVFFREEKGFSYLLSGEHSRLDHRRKDCRRK